VLDLTNTANNTGDAAGDTFSNIDQYDGSAFDDTMIGVNGQINRLFGGAGDDTITGGSNNDLLSGDAGADVLNGGAGFDSAAYGRATAGVTVDLSNMALNAGDAAGDTYISIEIIQGSRFDDTLNGDNGLNRFYGGDGNDTLSGGGGNDLLVGGAGADILNGGTGRDNASYAGATSGVTVDLANTANNTGDAAGDIYIDIEVVQATYFDDVLVGDSQANIFYASTGDDTISGNGGNDFIAAESGNDLISGGTGQDTFFFLTRTEGQDTISDFENDTDILDFRFLAFTNESEVLTLASAAGNDLLIDFGSGHSITMTNFAFADFDSGDFII
jgi:Ca2+-binding RTX toxin-like protein